MRATICAPDPRTLEEVGPATANDPVVRRRRGLRPDNSSCRCTRRCRRRAEETPARAVGRHGRRDRQLGSPSAPPTLQVRRRGTWRTIDRDRTTARGRYVLRDRVRRPMSVRRAHRRRRRRPAVGRLNVYRRAHASWYGPGLYGNHLGCGGRLTPGRLGVAHKTLPCGSKLTLRHRARTVARARDRPRPLRRRPRVRPHGGDRQQAALPRPRARSSRRASPVRRRAYACALCPGPSASSPTSTATRSTRPSSCCGGRSWRASR